MKFSLLNLYSTGYSYDTGIILYPGTWYTRWLPNRHLRVRSYPGRICVTTLWYTVHSRIYDEMMMRYIFI